MSEVRENRFTVLGTAFLSISVVVLVVLPLFSHFHISEPAIVRDELKGEVTSSESFSVTFPKDQRAVMSPQFVRGGRRAFFVTEDTVKRKWLWKWEEGLGFSSIGDNNVQHFSSFGANLEGTRVVFFASEGVLGKALDGVEMFLFLWEEGVGVRKLHKAPFFGDWHVSLSPNGKRVLLFPTNQSARFDGRILDKEAQKNTAIAMTLETRFSEGAEANPFPVVTEASLLDVPEGGEVSPGALDEEFVLHQTKEERGKGKLYLLRTQQRLWSHFVPYDLDGDRGADLLSFSRTSAFPFWRAYTLGEFDGAMPIVSGRLGRVFTWRVGNGSGIPVPGDYNGDGVLDLATFSPKEVVEGSSPEHNWKIYLSDPLNLSSGKTLVRPKAYVGYSWGSVNARPVPADYDGDGITDIAVFDGGTATWHVLYSGGGFYVIKGLLGLPGFGLLKQFGLPTDTAFGADFNGDSKADLLLWRPRPAGAVKAEWWVYVRGAENGQEERRIEFGEPDDVPVPADYNCDGSVDLAVYRPAEGKWYFRNPDSSIRVIPWGIEGAEPFAADFDGDGCDDSAFFNASGKYRYEILNSRFKERVNDFGFRPPVVTKLKWGQAEDLPVAVWQRRCAGGEC